MSASDMVDESVRVQPAEELRPFIAYYTGYRQVGVGPARHRGLPSPYMTLIFTLNEPLYVAEHSDPRQPAADYVTLVGGLHTSPALIVHDGRQSGIQVALSPLGARALLGLPAGEVANIDVDGTDVLGGVADGAQERMQDAGSWPERFAVLDEVLTSLAHAGQSGIGTGIERSVSAEVSHAWRWLLASAGKAPVAALIGETGWSDRHLRARFSTEIGLSPKAAARVIRFHTVRMALLRRAASQASAGVSKGTLDLAELAARYGYYDQAHLDKEFRALAGSPPTAWLAQERRNFQATADGLNAGSGL